MEVVSALENIPPEVIQSIAWHLPIATLKLLRLTCSRLEAAVRSQTLVTLCLFGSFDSDFNSQGTKKLAELASGKYRNVLHARTLEITGVWAWVPLNTYVKEAVQKRRRWKFWKKKTTKTIPIQLVTPGRDVDSEGPSAAEWEPDQPIRLLEAVLNRMGNIIEVRLSGRRYDTISLPAWEVLSSWIRGAPILSKLQIGRPEMLKPFLPQLLGLAYDKAIMIEWMHIHGTIGDLINNLHHSSPLKNPRDTQSSESRNYPRITSLYAVMGREWSPSPSFRCLRHLKSLDIELEFGRSFPADPTTSSLDAFWLALAAENIQLEDIKAHYTPSFQTYIKSYRSTLKTLRLRPYPRSFSEIFLFSDPDEETLDSLMLQEYDVLESHVTSLEHLELVGWRTGWTLESGSQWRYRGRPLDTLFKCRSLRWLYISVVVTPFGVTNEMASLLRTVGRELPSLDELAFRVIFQLDQRSSDSDILQVLAKLNVVEVIDKAITEFRYEYQEPNSTTRTQQPPRAVPRELVFMNLALADYDRTWKRSVDWNQGVYLYKPVPQNF